MESNIKKTVLLSNKITGFSEISDKLEMTCLCDKPAMLSVDKHHELVFELRPFNHKHFYRVDVGMVDAIDNSILSVKLIRKSLDVSGQIKLSVVLLTYDKSLKEMHEESESIKKQLESAEKVFGNSVSKKESEDVKTLLKDVGRLFGETFTKPRTEKNDKDQ